MTVTKMNGRAARRFFTGKIDNCRGGRVGRKTEWRRRYACHYSSLVTRHFAMLPLSYRSPKTEVRESKIHGRGLFATADIAKDEIVAIKGGHIVDRARLRRDVTPRLGPVEIQIDEDLFIAPITDEEREMSMLYSTHSCDPNLGIRGEITFVAMRDIRAGEELTHDWAMTDSDDYSIECKCGVPNCRKILTGKDWQRAELQKRYAGYFSAYIEKKIAAIGG
jgi:hypothetical protein